LDQTKNQLAHTQSALEEAKTAEASYHDEEESSHTKHTHEESHENVHSVPTLGYWNIRGLGS